MSSSSLATLGLSGVIAGILLANFEIYEQLVPEWYFQGAFIFDIFYQYAIKSKDLCVSAPQFYAISFFKRYHKFIILSVLYFGKFIRDMTLFCHILIIFILVGAVFYIVPLKFWTYCMKKIFPLSLILNITHFVLIGADVRFIFSITIQQPDKLAFFTNPAVEFIFISFAMGTLTPLIDYGLAHYNLSKKASLLKVLFSSCNWGFSAVLAYLVHNNYYMSILPLMVYYQFIPLCGKMELIRRIHLLYFCILGGFYSMANCHKIHFAGKYLNISNEREKSGEQSKGQTNIAVDGDLNKVQEDSLSNNSYQESARHKIE